MLKKKGIFAGQLKVYADKSQFEAKEACTETDALGSLGTDPNKPLLVVVPENPALPAGDQPLCKKRTLDDVLELLSPGAFASCQKKEKSWIQVLPERKGLIECHRFPPYDDRPLIPLVLLHEVFARFELNCTNINFGKLDCDFVVKFCHGMSEGYRRKTLLAQTARDILGAYACDDSLVEVKRNGFKSDGSYFLEDSLLLNLAVQLQKGGEGDPTMVNIAYYFNQLPKKIERAMPCFLVDICGPLLSVFGVMNVGNEYILCEPLVESLPLLYFDNPWLMEKTVRVCASLKAAMNELTNLYTTAPTDTTAVDRCGFPYHDSATIGGTKVKIRYINRLGGRYVFSAQAVSSDGDGNYVHDVVVKFAKRYGKDVHEYCASNGFAPALLHHQVLDHKWEFVVMEKLELVAIDEAKVEKAVLREHLENIKVKLSESSFVHGDLRFNNIWWESSKSRVVVIDFDWAGKDSKDVYPPFMNPDIEWPEGAETNNVLRTQHDQWWMGQILRKFKDE